MVHTHQNGSGADQTHDDTGKDGRDTEPALFGVLTKYKKGFLAATIGSCVGSAFIGAFGVRLYGYITSSIFSIPAYIGPYFIYAAIGWVIAFGLSFVLSYLFVVKMDRS